MTKIVGLLLHGTTKLLFCGYTTKKTVGLWVTQPRWLLVCGYTNNKILFCGYTNKKTVGLCLHEPIKLLFIIKTQRQLSVVTQLKEIVGLQMHNFYEWVSG